LDAKALESARAKRRATTRLGWAVPWGTVRMLGTFLTEEPTSVPASVVAFVAGQLGEDAEHFAGYGARQQTPYEHAWEGRDACGYRDFAAGEDELREFLAARVWSSPVQQLQHAEAVRGLVHRPQLPHRVGEHQAAPRAGHQVAGDLLGANRFFRPISPGSCLSALTTSFPVPAGRSPPAGPRPPSGPEW